MKYSEELAEKAIRYLTWGVEYTPNDQNGITLSHPYNLNYNDYENLVNTWISTDQHELKIQEKNYLNDSHNLRNLDLTNVKRDVSGESDLIHNITGDYSCDDILIYGNPKSGRDFTISRVDLYTANNLAWDDRKIKTTYPIEEVKNSARIRDGKI